MFGNHVLQLCHHQVSINLNSWPYPSMMYLPKWIFIKHKYHDKMFSCRSVIRTCNKKKYYNFSVAKSFLMVRRLLPQFLTLKILFREQKQMPILVHRYFHFSYNCIAMIISDMCAESISFKTWKQSNNLSDHCIWWLRLHYKDNWRSFEVCLCWRENV